MLINLQKIKLMVHHIKFQFILLMFLLLKLNKLKIEWQEYKKYLQELMLEKEKQKRKLELLHDFIKIFKYFIIEISSIFINLEVSRDII